MTNRMGLLPIQNSQAQQLTYEDGSESDWIVSLDGVELYRLPVNMSVQDTFVIRDIIQRMMEKAYDAGKEYAQTVADARLGIIVENGDAKLDALKAENERLAAIIDQTHGEAS